jgi:hypothetical protein
VEPRRLSDPGSFAGLSAVSADAADDIWAVGYSNDPHGSIVEHGDGTGWTLAEATIGALVSTQANAPYDVWAIDQSKRDVVRWTGARWMASIPMVLPIAVQGSGSNDVWAVGGDGPKADTSYAAPLRRHGLDTHAGRRGQRPPAMAHRCLVGHVGRCVGHRRDLRRADRPRLHRALGWARLNRGEEAGPAGHVHGRSRARIG